MSTHSLAPFAQPGDKAELHARPGDFLEDPPGDPLAKLTVGKDQSVTIDVPAGNYILVVNGVHVGVVGAPERKSEVKATPAAKKPAAKKPAAKRKPAAKK